ncbi:MAG: hypothetical protein U0350_43915 [Caldilineaceae bacterium]
MQPIIQRTITITIVETWTIIWPDGHETTWQATEEVVWPVEQAPSEPTPLLPTTADDRLDDDAGEQVQPTG